MHDKKAVLYTKTWSMQTRIGLTATTLTHDIDGTTTIEIDEVRHGFVFEKLCTACNEIGRIGRDLDAEAVLDGMSTQKGPFGRLS